MGAWTRGLARRGRFHRHGSSRLLPGSRDSYEAEHLIDNSDRFSKAIGCSTLRFVINEMYRGTQYNDACVAEVMLLSRAISDREAKSLVDVRRENTLTRPESMSEFLNIWDYIPFQQHSKAASLNGESTLRLTDQLPRIDGATALYPVYASFVQEMGDMVDVVAEYYN
ncbi:MAG: hypothetical protein LBC51_09980 [Treponema sp.]|jgi:hypothetical protein|nr:hypothetical protein [Treponema sp.]